jgi:RND family efflux transporter MFP subunit
MHSLLGHRGPSGTGGLLGPVGLAVIVTQALGLTGCKKPAGNPAQLTSAQTEAPIKVQTAPVTERPMSEHLVLTGTLRASQESEVAADAAGKVTATFVERGQRVKQGDVLVILDARGAAITATAAQAQSQLAKAQFEQAQRECERVKALKESGAISQAEYDRVTSQCQTTQWSVAAAQAQQKSAQKIVGDAIIRAPFSGVIGERYVNVGQYVMPSTRVVSLYAPDPLRLELTVPEANIGGVKQDQPVTFTVSAYGDEKFTGSVKLISPNVRPTTRDLVIEAFCPNPDGKLKPGMFAIAKLATAEKPQPAVPSAAIVTRDGVSRAFVVVDKRVQERIVQTGGERDGNTAVVVGLKVGEQVVVSPSPDVRDGAPVQ